MRGGWWLECGEVVAGLLAKLLRARGGLRRSEGREGFNILLAEDATGSWAGRGRQVKLSCPMAHGERCGMPGELCCTPPRRSPLSQAHLIPRRPSHRFVRLRFLRKGHSLARPAIMHWVMLTAGEVARSWPWPSTPADSCRASRTPLLLVPYSRSPSAPVTFGLLYAVCRSAESTARLIVICGCTGVLSDMTLLTHGRSYSALSATLSRLVAGRSHARRSHLPC